MRFAVVKNAYSQRQLEAYLPDNYEVIGSYISSPFGDYNYVVSGADKLGWTMDDYVIPRLASGGIFATEYPSHVDAVDAAAASMN